MRRQQKHGCCLRLLLFGFALVGLFFFAIVGGFCDFRFEAYRDWYCSNWRFAGEQAKQWEMPMPHPDSFSDARRVIFQQYAGNFWGEEAYILIAHYDPAMYEQKKHELDQRIVFQLQSIQQDEDKPVIEPVLTMGSFQMRFAKLGKQPYNLEFPKELCLIGTSDKMQEIVYIYYDDVDLDCVSQPMRIALPELIHWSSVRWQERLVFLKRMRIPVL